LRVRWLVVAVLLAGCLSSTPPREGPVPEDPVASVSIGFRFKATDCVEGGGHSFHPKLPNYLPEPWLPADVAEDTGTPPVYTEWYFHPTQIVPQEGNSMGNWHVTMTCTASSLDGRDLPGHVFGYVGMRVEEPPFDTGDPVDRHYLVTVVASNDAGLRDQLHSLGIHATGATGHVGPQGELFHNILDTDDHGVYESYFRPEEGGTMPPMFRLWFQRDNGNGTFSPVALDVHNVGGSRLRAAGFYGSFSHMETRDHAPLPGAVGESPALAYTGFDRVLMPGPAPAVWLKEAYVHS
jgi:hypothetical protein